VSQNCEVNHFEKRNSTAIGYNAINKLKHKTQSIHLIHKMKLGMARGEVYLRFSAILVLVLSACLVAFDTQTKVVLLGIQKKATYNDLHALK